VQAENLILSASRRSGQAYSRETDENRTCRTARAGPAGIPAERVAILPAADAIPSSYDHKVPVPGLAHSAIAAFPGVDEFDSREAGKDRAPKTGLLPNGGARRQDRNWFWYHRDLTITVRRRVAIPIRDISVARTCSWR
jgi:hypothetical protein